MARAARNGPFRPDSTATKSGARLVTRRDVLAGGAAASVAAATAARAAEGRPVPNILWLVSEDNNPLFGAYGDQLAHTPNIDGLAARGLLYRNAYSNAPVCAPSRFAILTGLLPEACAPANHMRAVATLPAQIETYPELLRTAGYYCTNNDKTDYNCDVDPKRIWDDSSSTAHWRNRPAGKPFMAVFNFMTTHESKLFEPTAGRVTPADVRIPPYLPDTPGVRQDYASYYNLIERMDGEVGARLAELEAAGLADDTIVFYYSDNGGVLPRSKRYCTDAGLRCALVVRVPPKWAHLAPGRPGTEIKAPVSFIDLAPTLLSIAGVAKPATMHGTALLGRAAAPKRFAFGMRNRMDERYDFVRTVTDGRYRYTRNYMPHRPMGQAQAYAWLAKGYQDWERAHLAGALDPVQDRFFQPRAYEEFYDLAQDSDELRNLAGEPHPVLAAMRWALDAHMLRINDNGFIPEGSATEGYLPSRVPGAYPLKALMALGAAAARRDPSNVPMFVARLSDANPVTRYWAATGLLILGGAARPAREALRTALRNDASRAVRIVAAESLCAIGPDPEAVGVLAGLLGSDAGMPVRLQSINALTYIGAQAMLALPTIRKAAEDENEYIRNASRYLSAKLEGRYDPAMPIFDLERMRRGTRPGG
jgi:arylsulfatase A-like enzyme